MTVILGVVSDEAARVLDAMEKQNRVHERELESWRPLVALVMEQPKLSGVGESERKRFVKSAEAMEHALSANRANAAEFAVGANEWRADAAYVQDDLSYGLRLKLDEFKAKAGDIARLQNRLKVYLQSLRYEPHWKE